MRDCFFMRVSEAFCHFGRMEKSPHDVTFLRDFPLRFVLFEMTMMIVRTDVQRIRIFTLWGTAEQTDSISSLNLLLAEYGMP